MTLYRQLLLWSILVLVCLCGGLWMGELTRTRAFLVQQLESHAQDTATSLGLSLTALTEGMDVPVMESMIDALFDRGYYHSIQVKDLEDTMLIERRYDESPEEVPAWFVSMVPLPTPQAGALIMQGWAQTGTVLVESNSGYAYQMLWKSVQNTALWFVGAAFAITLIGGVMLRLLLRPLARIEEQARGICDRNFSVQKHLPHTREFRQVVLTMNWMTQRIQKMFAEQSAIADSLLQCTYQDTLTAIGNRRYLETQVQARVEEKAAAKGSLLLLQLRDLQVINRDHGYERGDELVKETALILQQACNQLPEAVIGRLGGGDFALLLPNVGEQETNRVAETILLDLQHHIEAQLADVAGIHLSCGGVLYEQPASFTELLTRADTALNSTECARTSRAVLLPLNEEQREFSISAGKTEWKGILKRILAERSIVLYSQPTVSRRAPEVVAHHEILTRVLDPSGKHLSAGMFLPMAERLGLMPALDRMILEQLFALPLLRLVPARLSVNLSPISLEDGEFLAWLLQRLAQCAQDGVQMHFEFAEYRTLHYYDEIRVFAESIKKLGHSIGIDHFGQGLVNFGYLQSLVPDYVKIDRAITRNIKDEHSDNSFFINSLCTVAHSLDIRVIVEGIENEEQWQAMSRIHIDAAQGFYIQKPLPLQIAEKVS